MDPKMRYLSVLFSSAVLIGCGGGGQQSAEPVFPVTGTVTFNGQPVVGADITFRNKEKQRAAFGKTDDAGKYSLTTFTVKDGAVEGNSTVTITKHISQAEDVVEADLESEAYIPPTEGYDPPAKKEESGLPEKYADAATSGLTATVTADGPNEFDFEL